MPAARTSRPARATRPAPKLIARYGAGWPVGTDPAQIELDCIARDGRWTDANGNQCGMGLAYHMMAFDRLVWPWIQHHRWQTDLIVPELCRPRHRLVIFGPSSAGKSHPTGATYLKYWFARPDRTTVLISSTTREELELRIWGEIKMLFAEAKRLCPWLPGNLIDSKQMILLDDKDAEFGRDFRCGIVGRPCKIGNKWLIGSGTSPYVGIKNEYVYLAADEAGLMPQGFLDALANLTSNDHCSATILGNLGDLDTPLGVAAEPRLGWDALPDSDVSRVYDTRWCNGRAIQLIGKDSPNLDHPEGAEPFKQLIGRRYLAQCAEDYGLDTPLYNMFAAGKIPRGTMENRVITAQICHRFAAFEEVTWGATPPVKLYGADISYTAEHGDRTVGRPAAFGLDSDGALRLALLEPPLIYTPNDRGAGSIEDQLALQMRAECARLGIPPEHVFFDGSGRSSFTAAVMRLWSTSVNAIDFGGTATTRPNFIGKRYQEDRGTQRKGDLLPCNEVFGKFVTELWFAVRYCIEANQLRQLDEQTAKEGYRRSWKLTAGNKMDVESKREMKLRIGRSPDLFDCVVTILEGARRMGFRLARLDLDSPGNKARRSRWLAQVQAQLDEARTATALLTE